MTGLPERRGAVLAGRFEILSRAGAGGSGEVFQARDLERGALVAVKVLGERHATDEARFEQEAQVLSELRHPSIVGYVAHGLTGAGEPYLAMEWLDGEDLFRRLLRGPLTVGETVALGQRMAAGLAEAHARGIVHRDVKPSNILLREGRPELATMLDFGIAQLDELPRVTQAGAIVGTLGYMAPEQARSGQVLDASADVFSLGCVLFKCLTGSPAFGGSHASAVLAKILFEEAPRAGDLCAGVPAWLDALVARMLAKDPRRRPRDGAAVAAALASADPGDGGGYSSTSLTRTERRVLSVVLVGKGAGPAPEDTLREGESTREGERLRWLIEARGGRIDALADGSSVITVAGDFVAIDQATMAARCALAARALVPERPIAIATGRSELERRVPVGAAIDRAARLLSEQPAGRASIALDEVTFVLLDPRFETARVDGRLELVGEALEPSGARTLLGQRTPCVGRERELAALEALFAGCVEESTAQAVLVTARAGMGKSRLCQELVGRLRRTGDVKIWTGRGDPLKAGSTYGLLRQVVRSAVGLADGDPPAVARARLAARVGDRVPFGDWPRVRDLLGVLAGAPPPQEDVERWLGPPPQSAERMSAEIARAFVDFLRAECTACPVLLVLEDVHWTDAATAHILDGALRDLGDRPWMILALGRPEVHGVLPRLWASRDVQEVRLKPLSARAGERLVREVLGAAVGEAVVAHLVTLSEGHAFYLEELIRSVAEGREATLPETVVAMVDARLDALDAEARHVLRAASVFGETFWQSGVVALLGGAIAQPGREVTPRTSPVAIRLLELCEREILVRRPESRFQGEEELAFRHALLREGAYARLTDEDRALGHQLAGEWLEQRGEGDPLLLAEHFERGLDAARAAGHYLRAAVQAHRAGDPDAAQARAERGLSGAAPEVRVELQSRLCESHMWRSEWTSARRCADEVMRSAPPGSAPWARAVAARLDGALSLGADFEVIEMLEAIRRAEPAASAVRPFAFSLTTGVRFLDATGRFEDAGELLSRIQAGPAAGRDPVAEGWRCCGEAHHAIWAHEDPWSGLLAAEAARTSFEQVPHARGARSAQRLVGMSAWLLGDSSRAERELRSDAALEKHAESAVLRAFCLVGALADRGALSSARDEADRLVDTWRDRDVPSFEGRARWALADVLRRAGDPEAAEREIAAALARLRMPVERLAAQALHAAILLDRGRTTEAASLIFVVQAGYEALGGNGFRATFARLNHARARMAVGDHDVAVRALAAERTRLLARASRIGDAGLRRSFLERVPENAHLLALAP